MILPSRPFYVPTNGTHAVASSVIPKVHTPLIGRRGRPNPVVRGPLFYSRIPRPSLGIIDRNCRPGDHSIIKFANYTSAPEPPN